MVDHVQLLIFKRVGDRFNDVRVVMRNILVGHYLTVNVVAREHWAGHVLEVLVAGPAFSAGCQVLGRGEAQLVNPVGRRLSGAALDHVVNGPLDSMVQLVDNFMPSNI